MKTPEQWRHDYVADHMLPAGKRKLKWADGSVIKAIQSEAYASGKHDAKKKDSAAVMLLKDTALTIYRGVLFAVCFLIVAKFIK